MSRAVWVYKCKAKPTAGQPARGDWADFFDDPGDEEWGGTEVTRQPASRRIFAERIRKGDLVVAYQTDRNEIVGLTRVLKLVDRGAERALYLRPVKRLENPIRVREAKKFDARLRKIAAFMNGPRGTIFETSPEEAETLLGLIEHSPAATGNRPGKRPPPAGKQDKDRSHGRGSETARAWVHQLNPDWHTFSVRGRELATTVEHLFGHELRRKEIHWQLLQLADEVKAGDLVMVRVGGRKPAGIVAIGRVGMVERKNGAWWYEFMPDMTSSRRLRENPIPYEWTQRHVRGSRPNLVPVNARPFERELRKRGVDLGGIAGGGGREAKSNVGEHELPVDADDGMSEEGRKKLAQHVRSERKRSNRTRVLAKAARPYRCEVCGFSFADAFGPGFEDYIEVHHARPVSQGPRVPTADEFVLLCSNCHAIAHWKAGLVPRTPRQLTALRTRSKRSA